MEAPMSHTPELAYEVAGVLVGEVCRSLGEILESGLQALPGKSIVAILLGTLSQEFPADLVQLFLHLPITDKVHGFELVNEPNQAVEGALMHAGCAAVHALEHLLTQLGRLFP